MSELPWVECGEVFYGWSAPGLLTLDFSVPRRCNLPKDHRGSCDMSVINPAGHFPRRETKRERRQRQLSVYRKVS